jgi:FKBP12-rapamycin complex-associated protein
MEYLEMLKIAPDYDSLSVMQKVEVFTDGMKRTTGNGNDLYEILRLKSTNSEDWLEHRTKYTRILAVMSLVGYILGLGDRHPASLMLDKLSGRSKLQPVGESTQNVSLVGCLCNSIYLS